jgi:hypothetical protein
MALKRDKFVISLEWLSPLAHGFPSGLSATWKLGILPNAAPGSDG